MDKERIAIMRKVNSREALAPHAICELLDALEAALARAEGAEKSVTDTQRRIIIRELILEIEAEDFRTIHDTGATGNCQKILHALRSKLGLPFLTNEDLPYPAPDGRRVYDMPPNSNLLAEIEKRASTEPRP